MHHHHHHFYLSPYDGYVLVELLCTQKKKNEKTIYGCVKNKFERKSEKIRSHEKRNKREENHPPHHITEPPKKMDDSYDNNNKRTKMWTFVRWRLNSFER